MLLAARRRIKPATPLTNGVINETLQHFAPPPISDISQGSVAHFRCGGVFNDDIIANFSGL